MVIIIGLRGVAVSTCSPSLGLQFERDVLHSISLSLYWMQKLSSLCKSTKYLWPSDCGFETFDVERKAPVTFKPHFERSTEIWPDISNNATVGSVSME